jgi:hypothetical protein
MAIPTHYIKKRDQLHADKASPAGLSQVGREFFKLERYSDALDFFEKARDKDGIQQVKQVALERGDTFLLSRLDRFDREMISQQDWEAAGKKAEAQGRASMMLFVMKRMAAVAAAAAGQKEAKAEVKPGTEPIAEV